MSNLNIITRRRFLSHSAKVGAGIALSTLVDIPFVMKRALAEGSIGLNGKKLLFIWLRGANDALNSVIPIQDPAYAASRPTLALPMDPGQGYGNLGPAYDATVFNGIAGRTSADPTYSYGFAAPLGNGFAALHPSLKFLAPIYNAGDLALVHRVGYPKQSRSHFDSQNYWENGSPNNNLNQDGIFYRTMVESGLANTQALTGVSIQSSLPLILRGSAAAMTNLSDPERYALLGIPNTTNGIAKATAYLTNAIPYPFAAKKNRELLSLQYDNLSKTLATFDKIDFDEGHNTYQDNIKTDADTDWVPVNDAGASIGDASKGYFLFPTTNDKNGGWRRPNLSTTAGKYAVDPTHQNFFKNLKAAALVLNQTDAIVCGTELGGFDTHKTQGTLTGDHPNLQRAIGWSLYGLRKYFMLYGKGGPLAVPGAKVAWNEVVVITLSEFGRTTVENSDLGTDHAEAGTMFVAGGAIKGYNKGNPSGVFNCHPQDPAAYFPWIPGSGGSMFGVSGRYLKRNTDYRSVLGEIIRKHLGSTQNQLNRIIPSYATIGEKLLSGGTSALDGTPIRGEVGIL